MLDLLYCYGMWYMCVSVHVHSDARYNNRCILWLKQNTLQVLRLWASAGYEKAHVHSDVRYNNRCILWLKQNTLQVLRLLAAAGYEEAHVHSDVRYNPTWVGADELIVVSAVRPLTLDTRFVLHLFVFFPFFFPKIFLSNFGILFYMSISSCLHFFSFFPIFSVDFCILFCMSVLSCLPSGLSP